MAWLVALACALGGAVAFLVERSRRVAAVARADKAEADMTAAAEQQLRDGGVTDVLRSELEAAKARCERMLRDHPWLVGDHLDSVLEDAEAGLDPHPALPRQTAEDAPTRDSRGPRGQRMP